MIDIVDILCEEFGKSGAEDTEENYVAFIKQFETKHNIIIGGSTIRENWHTSGYSFENSEDEVIFKLKYS